MFEPHLLHLEPLNSAPHDKHTYLSFMLPLVQPPPILSLLNPKDFNALVCFLLIQNMIPINIAMFRIYPIRKPKKQVNTKPIPRLAPINRSCLFNTGFKVLSMLVFSPSLKYNSVFLVYQLISKLMQVACSQQYDQGSTVWVCLRILYAFKFNRRTIITS